MGRKTGQCSRHGAVESAAGGCAFPREDCQVTSRGVTPTVWKEEHIGSRTQLMFFFQLGLSKIYIFKVCFESLAGIALRGGDVGLSNYTLLHRCVAQIGSEMLTQK